MPRADGGGASAALLRRLTARRPGLDDALAGAVLALVLLVVGANVAARYVSIPMVWSLELVEIAFPWLVFLGAAAAFRARREVVVDSLYAAMPLRLRQAMIVFALAVTAAVGIVLTLAGIGLAERLSAQHSMILGLSLGWRSAALPAGMALIALYALARLLHFALDPAVREEDARVTHSTEE